LHRTLALPTLVALALAAAAHGDNQTDGGAPGDASDACGDLNRLLEVGNTTFGALDPPRDADDYYGLDIQEEHVNGTINVTLEGSSLLQLDVLTPQCGQSVVPHEHAGCNAGGCPPGHENNDGHGHACTDHGHTFECPGEGGEAGDGYVRFTPSGVGVYVIHVSIDPQDYPHSPPGERFPPGDDLGANGCHEGCENPLGYALSSADEAILL
jgi:hypothetical protein